MSAPHDMNQREVHRAYYHERARELSTGRRASRREYRRKCMKGRIDRVRARMSRVLFGRERWVGR